MPTDPMPPAIDPVCGMTPKPTTAHRVQQGGREVLFCSASCKRKFEAEPGKYPAREGGGAKGGGGGHGDAHAHAHGDEHVDEDV